MCGIAGVLIPSGKPAIEETSLQKLRDLLHHRGPDDSGIWRSADGQAAFVHTRLSILDLSQAGHQPMSLSSDRLTITFNGEIYNFRELRRSLEESGIRFQTDTDTEVILRLYERDGTACLGQMRGMYAIAIWDALRRTCFIARDPLGIKPLYYTETSDGRFAFASELRALRHAGFGSGEINPTALADYFETGSVPEPLTLIKGVNSLTPGHYVLWKDGAFENHRHWQFTMPDEQESPAYAARHLREALLDSVRRHFVSDVPVGIFLSGGIDSTALLALARETGHDHVSTFSVGVDDTDLDESSLAKRTAGHFGADHHEMRLDEASGMKLFEEFTSHIDQPSIDGFNTFTVSRFAREHGMKVVLSGLGSDEMFAGYPSFIRVPNLVRLARTLGAVPGMRQFLGRVMEAQGYSNRVRRLGTFFQSDPCVTSAMRAFRGIFSRSEAVKLAAMHSGVAAADIKRPVRVSKPPMPTIEDDVSRNEITHYMRNQLLKDSDVMSMAHGLELRVPFVDRTLLEAALRIPASARLQHGKKILLAAVPEVPEWIARQPKRGFLFPYQKWLQGKHGRVFEELAASSPVPMTNWYQKWSLFVLRRSAESLNLPIACS